ncbi:hypothetical protein A4X13_0g9454, partial [Tilletia indica]
SAGVDPSTKVIIYSDGLDVEKCIDLAKFSKELTVGLPLSQKVLSGKIVSRAESKMKRSILQHRSSVASLPPLDALAPLSRVALCPSSHIRHPRCLDPIFGRSHQARGR